jgi:MoaA/NifB/PqqE/SkfB family radical SAM enzyme
VNFKFNNSKDCCLAPYSTLNFDTMGYIRVCCYNNDFILGKYPENSLKECWNNPERKKFINDIKELNFPKGCDNCVKQILDKNISNGLFTSFDSYDPFLRDSFNQHPIAFNFDFGTICNYECIMCGGKWSSSIRKNREKLPPIKSPYDNNFVEQLKPFLYHLRFANFLGGEPFLNPIYYKILNIFLIKNRNVFINFTTNGSIYNSKIENYLINLPNSSITISLDSLKEDVYQFIRKNGNFKTVTENIKKFKKINRLKGIAFCPMIQNVYELPDIIKFANDNNLHLYINTVNDHLGGKLKGIHDGGIKTKVWTGSYASKDVLNKNHCNNELIPEVALHTLPKDKIKDIVSYLNKFSFEKNLRYNQKYKDFINSLEAMI